MRVVCSYKNSMRQLLLNDDFHLPTGFGGEDLIGVRKGRRPFSSKQAMHIVFRSSRCKGPTSFLMPKRARFVRAILRRLSSAYGIRVYRTSLNSNHIHLIIRSFSKRDFVAFCRSFSGILAFHFLGAKKGNPFEGAFWDYRPFSRILLWGRAFQIACKYVEKNLMEAYGQIAYVPREATRRTHQAHAPP